MDKILINSLLDKYFEGGTTLDEDKILKRYFKNGKVAPEHLDVKPLFDFFEAESSKPETVNRHSRNYLWIALLAAACALTLFILTREEIQTIDNQSFAYIDGKRETDVKLVSTQIVNSLYNLSEAEADVASLQIEVLNMFTQ
jgi:hypothetical protein